MYTHTFSTDGVYLKTEEYIQFTSLQYQSSLLQHNSGVVPVWAYGRRKRKAEMDTDADGGSGHGRRKWNTQANPPLSIIVISKCNDPYPLVTY